MDSSNSDELSRAGPGFARRRSRPCWAHDLAPLPARRLSPRRPCRARRRPAAPAPRDGLDAVARDYVQLVLELGERDEGYVDAYYGPADWRTAARANPRTLPQLAAGARGSCRRGCGTIRSAAGDIRRRAAASSSCAASSTPRSPGLRMLQGERLSFREEARDVYGVRPRAAAARRFRSGAGADRRGWCRARARSPRGSTPSWTGSSFRRDRLDAVMRAAIAECRRRTSPTSRCRAGEHFTLEFVTGRNWSGYNWYQGNYNSLIQVNTDQPVRHRPGDRSRLPRRLSRPSRLQHAARAQPGARAGLGRIYGLSALFAAELHRRGHAPITASSSPFRARSGSPSSGASSIRSPACRAPAPTAYLQLQDAIRELSGARIVIAARLARRAGSTGSEAIRRTQRYS